MFCGKSAFNSSLRICRHTLYDPGPYHNPAWLIPLFNTSSTVSAAYIIAINQPRWPSGSSATPSHRSQCLCSSSTGLTDSPRHRWPCCFAVKAATRTLSMWCATPAARRAAAVWQSRPPTRIAAFATQEMCCWFNDVCVCRPFFVVKTVSSVFLLPSHPWRAEPLQSGLNSETTDSAWAN